MSHGKFEQNITPVDHFMNALINNSRPTKLVISLTTKQKTGMFDNIYLGVQPTLTNKNQYIQQYAAGSSL